MSSSAEPPDAIPASYRLRLCASVNVIRRVPSEYTAVAPVSTTDADLSAESNAMPDVATEPASISSSNPTLKVPSTKPATGASGVRSGGIVSGTTSKACEVVPAKKLPRESRTVESETSISIPGSWIVSASLALSRMMSVRCASVSSTSARFPSASPDAPARLRLFWPCASFSAMPLASTRPPRSLSNVMDSVPVPRSMDAPVSSGRTVSISMSLLYDSEPARPGTGSASAAPEFEPSAVTIAPPSSRSDWAPT